MRNSSISKEVINETILGDSIVKGRGNNLLGQASKQRVSGNSFPGATVSDMRHFRQPILEKRPREVILHVGTNCLKNQGSRTVGKSIADLGRRVTLSSPDT